MHSALIPMLPNFRPFQRARGSAVNVAALVLASIVFLAGCASPLPVISNPPGATAVVGGKEIGVTPTQVQLPDQKPTPVEFRKEGYFTESFVFQPGANQKQISADLEPTTLTKKVDFTSNPTGATVTIDGREIGRTPLAGHEITFTRDSKVSPWKRQALVISKTNYQSETLPLVASMNAVPRVELSLLREDRVYSVSATTISGDALSAEVTVNGVKLVNPTPVAVQITFARPDKSAPWPKFDVAVEIPGKYKRVALSWDYPSSTTVALKLEPVVEIVATLVSPGLSMTPTGIALKVSQTKATAILSTRETADGVSDLKPVTIFPRQDLLAPLVSRRDSINSYCVSPDGQSVIFSLTEHDQQGSYFSNLFVKRADDSAGGVTQLTEGSRYLDTMPYIANDGSNYLVFASNRSDRNKPDIFRANLIDNRLSGGISRLTNDSRYNVAPSYGDSNRHLFYLSTEPNFPLAEPIICSIRIDGSLPTQMPISATEISNAFAEKVFYVRIDADTKTKQIFSITADGKLETALINQEAFKKHHCFQPAVSPDGSRVLFTSDHGTDDQGRSNNDIFLINSNGTGLQRLTKNGSDDIMPAWSPSEENVIFFLSNRGGAYNVWRFKLIAGSK